MTTTQYAPAGEAGRLTPAERESAQALADLGAAMRKGRVSPDEYRSAARASREQHGDARHEVVKWHAIHVAPQGA